MNKVVKEIAITAFLIVVLAVIVLNNLRARDGSKKSAKESKSDQQPVEVRLSSSTAATPGAEIVRLQKERAAILVWARDPFEYVETETDKGGYTDALSLRGVSIGKDRPCFAFINNEIVRVGDFIGGYQVVQIERDKVLVKKGNQAFYLTLSGE